MLPEILEVKSAVFTQRIDAYNETFSPLTNASRSTADIWHHGIIGRNDEDISSAILKMLKLPQLLKLPKLVLWLDNCSAHNKNWTLLTKLGKQWKLCRGTSTTSRAGSHSLRSPVIHELFSLTCTVFNLEGTTPPLFKTNRIMIKKRTLAWRTSLSKQQSLHEEVRILWLTSGESKAVCGSQHKEKDCGQNAH